MDLETPSRRLPPVITEAEIERRMAHHPARGSQPVMYQEIRSRYIALAMWMIKMLPQGPDLSSAVDKLVDAMRATNAVVGCNDVGVDELREITISTWGGGQPVQES